MNQDQDRLAAELEAWCKANALPFVSADELISRDLPFEQKRWLAEFLDRWEAADTGSLSMLEQDDEEQAEQVPHVWYPMGTPLQRKAVLLLRHPPFEDRPLGYQLVKAEPLPDGAVTPPREPGEPDFWMIIESPEVDGGAFDDYVSALEDAVATARDALRSIIESAEAGDVDVNKMANLARKALRIS